MGQISGPDYPLPLGTQQQEELAQQQAQQQVAQSPVQQSLTDFQSQIGQINPRFLNANFQGLDPSFLSGIQNRLGHLNQTYGDLGQQAQQQFGGFAGQAGALGGQAGALSQQAGGELDAVRNRFQNISQGNDPRFAAFEAGQRGLLNNQRQGALDQTRQELARTGVRGTAALNDLSRINQGFNVREQALSGDIGLQQLGRQDTALGNLANLTGQRTALQSGLLGQQGNFLGQQAGLAGQGIGLQAGLAGQQAGLAQQQLQNELVGIGSANQAQQLGLDASSIGLQNLAAIPGLNIAALAAANAGRGGGK